MKKNGILVVGSANMDLVVRTKRFPAPGETLFGSEFGMYPGGKGANQAVCAAKLGGNVFFIGKMGDDLFGRKLVSGMQQDGVRMDHLLLDAHAPTGIALISVDGSGQNEIVVVSGSNMTLLPSEIRRAGPAFASARVLLLQLEIPLPAVREAALIARARGVTVILNPAPARRLPRALLGLADFLTPNETELGQLSGMPVSTLSSMERAAHALIDRGVQRLVVTLGKKGSLFVDRSSTRLFSACRVRAVDTTAAGDAFNGALAYALSSGRDVPEAIPFANAVAALSVTRRGAQSSMPTMKELRSFLD